MSEHREAGSAADTTEDSAQYLTFTLDGEEYAVDILRVQEKK